MQFGQEETRLRAVTVATNSGKRLLNMATSKAPSFSSSLLSARSPPLPWRLISLRWRSNKKVRKASELDSYVVPPR